MRVMALVKATQGEEPAGAGVLFAADGVMPTHPDPWSARFRDVAAAGSRPVDRARLSRALDPWENPFDFVADLVGPGGCPVKG